MGLLFTMACEDDANFITSGDVQLEFSLDTLRFDTVFTELGSATRSIKIYNRNDGPVRIQNIYLEQGDNSKFRINVDGDPGGKSVQNAEIFANDSIYAFIEVTIDPDDPLSNSPFVVEERLIFETNDNQQSVNLEAWGQNANYFPSRFNKGVPVVLTCDNQEIVWDDPKPYVIYGEVFIDSCLLTIPAGARIHVHGGIARNDVFGVFNDGILYFLKNGRINVTGTVDNPVIIQGDRLEEPFLDEAGQWFGIIFGRESRGNFIEHASIRNSNVGFYADSASTVTLKNTQIYNTAGSGILAYNSGIFADNCLIYNNFGNSVQLIKGGRHVFNYCTIASYGVDASSLAASNFFCFDDFCNVFDTNPLDAEFNNSIIFGSSRDEIVLSDVFNGEGFGQFNVRFNNCIVKIDELLTERDGLYADFLENQCQTCISADRTDVLFVDPNADDYRLDSLSIADGTAKPIFLPIPINTDLLEKARDPNTPDIGCFERIEQ